MKSSSFAFIGCLLALCSACQTPFSEIGEQRILVFENLPIVFAPKANITSNEADTLVLHAGRVVLKKLTLPVFQQQTQVTAHVTLSSNGDPWDKSGSLFVIPVNDDLSLLDLAQGQFPVNQLAEAYPGVAHFESLDQSYFPAVELLRFITPFGAGYYSDHPKMEKLKPPSITRWASEVAWSADISHLLSLLENEVWVGVYIDTWSDQGYLIDVALNVKPAARGQSPRQPRVVLPLINTTTYTERQRGYDGFAKADLVVEFELPKTITEAQLYFITTGHGGHSTGDEFTPREHRISLDGNLLSQFTPWRDDCTDFRHLNPSSGVWTETKEIEGKVIEVPIASSDYARSNWCPGSDVPPQKIALGNLQQGKHRLSVSIPAAQPGAENEYNSWNVSAYLVY